MEQWKEIINSANRAFQEGRDSEAEQLYKSACQRAAPILRHWEDREAAVAMLAVSYQNLADLYFRQGRCDEALEVYGRLLRQFAELCRSEDSDKELAQIAERALRKAGTEFSYEVRTRKLALPAEYDLDLVQIRSLFS